jgi:hypothetical protein
MELYLYSPYVFLAWWLVKHMIHLHDVVLSKTQCYLYRYLAVRTFCLNKMVSVSDIEVMSYSKS